MKKSLPILLLALFVGELMAQPVINSFTPSSAKPGDEVTLTGTGFNTTAANNVVFFGATQGTVTAASATSITVTVPPGATYAPITLLNTGSQLSCASLSNFNPVYSPVKSTVSFSSKVDYTTDTSPKSVAIGDLNGDGKPDLAVVGGTSTLSVFRNISVSGSITAGSFAAKVDFTTGAGPTYVSMVDLNGDGKLDLVTANSSINSVSVFRNTSTGGSITFAASVNISGVSTPQSVTIGDIDGDGKPDMVATSSGLNRIYLFRNTSVGSSISFAAAVIFSTGSATNPTFTAVGDIDGDGKPDLATANSSATYVWVFRNISTVGSISLEPAVQINTGGGSNPYCTAIGDLDGDGKPEMITANKGTNTVSVFRNTATSGSIVAGSFAARVDFALGTGYSPESVAIGDLDGNGKPDLAVANAGGNNVSVLRNTSVSGNITTGSFSEKADFNTATQPRSVAIGDLDGDGKPELVAANNSSASISVLRSLDPSPEISSFTPASAKPGDAVILTGTGFNATGANNIVFFGATRAAVTAASTTSITVTVPFGATYAPITLLNTGNQLACSSRSYFNPVYSPIKTNITLSDFLPKVDFAAGSGPRAVAIGDLDGDGKSDLAVANTNTGMNSISVYRNTSASGSLTSGSFAAKVDFTPNSGLQSVAIADLDGDGKPELVASILGGFSVFRNIATSGSITTGSFASRVDFTGAGSGGRSAAIGDLDGDGKPELVRVDNSFGRISVFSNISTSGVINAGSFAAKVDFTTGSGPESVAIGDLDGDGMPDLAVAVAGGGNGAVSVLRNTTQGGLSFAAKVDFSTGTGSAPLAVAIGDLDGDGKSDLAVANNGTGVNTVSVFRNTATSGTINAGSFAAKVDFSTGLRPASVAIGDLDGNGKPDLAVANNGTGTNTISVLRNISTTGSITSGSFAAKVDFATGTGPAFIAIGDLDGDTKPDLVAANNGSGANSISVLRNADLPPVISSFTPSSGCAGSTSFTITGTSFTGATSVLIGGTAVNSFTVNSDTEITATAGNGTTGTIQVTTPVGTSTSTGIFTVNPFPAAAGTVTGTATVCQGQSAVSYSVPAIANATGYNWTLPAGASIASGSNTNSITVNYSVSATSGNISVQGSNGCGNGTASANLAVTVNIPSTWYLDADGDGYSVIGSSVSSCNSPGAGYVLTTSGNDCNDANNSIWRTGDFYTDADGDNYTVGTLQSLCYGASTPTGYSASSLGTDCDDANNNIWRTGNFYTDADGDNYTVGAVQSLCYGAGTPAGYSASSLGTDCDDSDNSKWRTASRYADADGDGYGTGSLQTICYGLTIPSGYVTNDTDCDDTDNSKWRTGNFYTDADGDNYTVGAVQSLCYGAGTPAGFSTVSLGTDCDDTNPSLNSNCSSYVWMGAINSDWNTPSNWSSNVVPNAGIDVLIPAGTPFSIHSGGGFNCKSVTLLNGAMVTISSGGVWNIKGDIHSGPFVLINGTGKVVLNGTGIQNLNGIIRLNHIDFANTSVAGVVVTPNSQLQIEPGGVVSFLPDSRLNTNGNMLLTSSATGSAKIGPIPATAVISGEIAQERYLPYGSGPGAWYFLGSPFSGKNFIDFVDDFKIVGLTPGFGSQGNAILPTPNPERNTIFKYDEPNHHIRLDTVQKQGWAAPGAAENVVPGIGYRMWVDYNSNSTHKFDNKGTLTRNDVNFPLNHTVQPGCIPASFPCNEPGLRGWNLLANPYPCDIDWDATGGAWTKPAGLNNAFYTWNAAANGYRVYVGSGGSALGVTSSGVANPNIIPGGQGFFVYLTTPGTPNLTIKESAKITSSAGTFSRMASNEQRIKIRLTRSGDNAYQYDAMLRMQAGATDQFDLNRDAQVLSGPGYHFGFSSFGSMTAPLVLQTIEQPSGTKVIPMEMDYKGSMGTYKFSFSELESLEPGMTVYLKDNYTGELIPVESDTEAEFLIMDESTASSGRFELILQPEGLTSVSGYEKGRMVMVNPNPSANSEGAVLVLKGFGPGHAMVQITDMTGREISSVSAPLSGAGTEEINLPQGLPAGVYTIKIQTGTQQITRKWVVK